MAVYSSAGFPPCDLWDFAIKLYSEDAVSEACLALQDRMKIDVNLLLFCVWVAASGRETLTEQELEEGIASASGWQSNVVDPLRAMRRYLRSPENNIDNRLASDLRRIISDSEIYSERLELQMLGKLIDRPVTSSFGGKECADAAAENLLSYMSRVTDRLEDEDRKDLLVIWQTAFPSANVQTCNLAADRNDMLLRF
ncbi:MAG: TIGR02444 family protein [Sneathiella sp.]|nr:TIGR02444 family protein [Sneathiella sp.]